MNRKIIRLAAVVLAALLISAGFAFSKAELFAGQKAGVEAVAPSIVCMVNDEVMHKEQIPVEFEGKTYFGCCAGCVNTLKTERDARTAIDPLTGKEVDKATAFITEGPGKAALYFESRESAEEFHSRKGI